MPVAVTQRVNWVCRLCKKGGFFNQGFEIPSIRKLADLTARQVRGKIITTHREESPRCKAEGFYYFDTSVEPKAEVW